VATRSAGKPVAVLSCEGLLNYERLLRAVGELYGVIFTCVRKADPRLHSGALLLDASRAEAMECGRRGLRTLAFTRERPASSVSGPSEVKFGTSPALSSFFHRASLRDPGLQTEWGLVPTASDVVIARHGGEVVWVRSEVAAPVDLIAGRPPVLSTSEYLYSLFCDKNWFRLLPLLHFVHELSGWTPPPVRACFMFDDPNLHWTSYGYVRYDSIIEHANAHNYHVAFATVPLDTWYTNRAAARLFRSHGDRVSLLVHGNDHLYSELLRTREPLAVAAQALRRIERLERAAGVTVSRVMAAPHGACRGETARALLRSGFEGACISRSSLMARNPDVSWPLSVGLRLAEWFDNQSVPIIPRFNIHADPAVRVRLAMFLGQPVIPVGHHQDLRFGLQPLEDLAGFVNSLADVQWENMKSISRSNFLTRREGDVLHVRTYSRRIDVDIPYGVGLARIERAWGGDEHSDNTVLRQGTSAIALCRPEEAAPMSVRAGTCLTVSDTGGQLEAGHEAANFSASLRAIVRRQLCEGRDRLLPAVNYLLHR
jgi:hypothetical protein